MEVAPNTETVVNPEPTTVASQQKNRYRRYRWIPFGLAGILFLIIIIFIIYAWQDMPPIASLYDTSDEYSTVLYANDNKTSLGTLYSKEHRIPVTLDQVSIHIQHALIATEDIRFYEHSGIDAETFLSIIKRFVTTQELRGGSTITQQLARNLYDKVGTRRSFTRKLKEAVAAVVLERQFTKDEIMMHYLNTVPWGANVPYYGVEAAAKLYFNKRAKALTLTEAALLVGILKNPVFYNPLKYPERALARRNTVIDQMEKYHFITKDEATAAKKTAINIKQYHYDNINAGIAPHFRDVLYEFLQNWYEEKQKNGEFPKDKDLNSLGLRVFTTIDPQLQQFAETAVDSHMHFIQKKFNEHIQHRKPWERDTTILMMSFQQSGRYRSMKAANYTEAQILDTFKTVRLPMRVFKWQDKKDSLRGYIDTILTPWDSMVYYQQFLRAGFIAIEPESGHILAWVGGLDHTYFQFDHVKKGKRQVGSTFKPFVYATAFTNNYSPCYQELNEPFDYPLDNGKVWTPKNSDASSGGMISLKDALARSLNIVTARLMRNVGPRAVIELAKNMGVESELEPVPALALGSCDMSLMELVSAFATFANKGRWREPVFITRIEDRNGNVLAQFSPNNKVREALSEEGAYAMIEAMRNVVNAGTAGRLRYQFGLTDVDLCGKTGTTQNQSDGWFVGYSPHICAGAWVGGEQRKIRFSNMTYGQGAQLALPIFGIFMRKVYREGRKYDPKERFIKPRNIQIETDCSEYQQPGEMTDQKKILKIIEERNKKTRPGDYDQ